MGTIRYEFNPPKVSPGMDESGAIARSMERLLAIAPKCNSIHITENVLGNERVSPIVVGRNIKQVLPDMPITVSLRVRDKTGSEIDAFVSRCIDSGFEGILVLMGDPSRHGRPDTGQKSSAVAKRLRESVTSSKIDLYMSVSDGLSASQVQQKILARPVGFFTQVVHSVQQVRSMASRLDGFRVVPVLLHPSPKNQKSAEFLNLDLGSYSEKFEEFVRGVHRITGDLLITSPNDFAAAYEFLDGLDI